MNNLAVEKQEIELNDLNFDELVIFKNNNLINLAKNKNEVRYIYENIIDILRGEEGDTTNCIVGFKNLLTKYLFDDKKKYFFNDFSNFFKKIHINYFEFFLENNTPNNNIFNILLTSPYLDNDEKIHLYNQLLEKNLTNYSSFLKVILPPFIIKDSQYDMLLFLKEYHKNHNHTITNFINDNKNNIDNRFLLNLFESIVYNKDIDNLNLHVSQCVSYLETLTMTDNRISLNSNYKVLKNILKENIIEFFNSILKDKFCSLNLNKENLKNIYSIINNKEYYTEEDLEEEKHIKLKSNFFCYQKKGMEDLKSEVYVLDLVSSDYAIKDKEIRKKIIKNFDISDDIETYYEFDEKYKIIVEDLKDSNSLFENKFYKLCYVYSKEILKNRNLFDLFREMNNIKETELEPMLEVYFSNNITSICTKDKLSIINKELKEIINKTELETKDYNKLDLFTKNINFCSYLFKNGTEETSNKTNTVPLEVIFYRMKEIFKSKVTEEKRIDFSTFSIVDNLMLLDNTTENREFIKYYLKNVIEISLLNKVSYYYNSNKNFDSHLFYSMKPFFQLENKFQYIIKEIYGEIKYEDFKKNNNDYLKEIDKSDICFSPIENTFFSKIINNLSEFNMVLEFIEKEIENITPELLSKLKINKLPNFNF